MDELDVMQMVLLGIQIVVGVVMLYKYLKGSNESNFMKRTEKVLDYLKQQKQLSHLTGFIELALDIAVNKSLTAQQIEKISTAIKQIVGV